MAEDIADAVVANLIAAAKLVMGVVVVGAVKDFIKVGDIISGEVKKKLDDPYKKGQGKIFVHSTVLERDFKDLIPWFKLKYKYTQVVIDYDQNRTIQKDN